MTREREAGFTLVELMISLVIFSIVIAGVLSVAVAMTQTFREQRQAIAAETAARNSLDFMADALRQASPAVPDPTQLQDASTCATGAVTVTNNADGTGPDQLSVIFASGAVVTSLRTAYAGGTTVDVADPSQLAAGDSIVISNSIQGHLVKITAVNGSTLTLAAACSGIALPSGGYPPGSVVVRARQAVFFISTTSGIPLLMMRPDTNPATPAEPLADEVEDLQIAAAYDATGDGVSELGAAADDDEWLYNVAGDSPLPGQLRALRITLVVRTPALFGAPMYTRPTAEDHAAATTRDAHRRRSVRAILEIRNATTSP